MTLVEFIVAITVLLIVMAGIAAGATSGLALARGNTNRIVAANVADEVLGEIRTLDFAAIPQTVQVTDVVRGGVTYEVRQEAEMVFLGADGSCEAPTGPFNTNELSYLRVVVEVSWPRMNGVNPVRTETVIDPPVADFDPYRGHLAVTVTDRDGAGLGGVTVRLRNADAATPAKNTFEVTDAQGCAFFGNLDVIPDETVGNYHVWLDEAGYVDRASGLTDTSAQSPEPIVNVVSAQLRKVEFNYDRAAVLDTTLVGRFGGIPFDGLPITITNDNYNGGNGPVTFASTDALVATPLHPFSAGFGLWAGSCTDADPGSSDRTRLATDPDVTTTSDVTMGSVSVHVTQEYKVKKVVYYSDVEGAVLEAVDACGNTYAATMAPTDAVGQTAVALPYGEWTISVQGASTPKGYSWPTVTLSAADLAAPSVVVVTN